MAWTEQSAVSDTYKELQGVSDTFKAQNLMSDTWVSLIVTYGGFQADAFQTNAFQMGEVGISDSWGLAQPSTDLFVKQGEAL